MATVLTAPATFDYAARIGRLRDRFESLGIDAFLVTNPFNRRYLSGFTGSAGSLLVTPDAQWLATDSRYYLQVEAECPDWTLLKAGYGYLKALIEEFDFAGRRIGIEKDHLTLAEFEKFTEAAPEAQWVQTSMVINELRAIKDEGELAIMRETIRLGDQALAAVLPVIKPGVSENAVIREYHRVVRELGCEGVSYEPIFGAGANSAVVHHRGSDYIMQKGDVLLVDAGVKHQGYCSDMTRCFFVGAVDPEMKAIYDIVLASHLYGYEVTGAGVAAKDVDLRTRAIIDNAGYGEQYGHSYGHGIGLEVHERPRVSKLSEDTIAVGMLHTIEPGIYIPGKGGIRVEDICYIGPEGPEQLTGSPKEMLVLG